MSHCCEGEFKEQDEEMKGIKRVPEVITWDTAYLDRGFS
jgi:hypothetical protein